jgi:hypothetical protein
MTYEDGQVIGENAIDATAVAEERYPGCELLKVKTSLVLRYEGKIYTLDCIKERT